MEIINSVRIDKNFAFNILDFKNIEDAQTRSIIKSLLLYFSFQYEKDLFGYGKIDPVIFSKLFKHDRSNLSRKIENAKYKLDNLKSDAEWNTYLENALYILATTPIFEEYRGQDENYNVVGIKNYVILKELYKFNPNKKNRGKLKKYYSYVLDSAFETNLKKFFLNININSYLEAKKWNGEDFYVQIMNIYSQSKNNGLSSFYWSINDLTKFFNVSHPEIRIQKQKINIILKKYENILKNEINGLTFEWKKTGNQKYAYTLFMIWEKEDQKENQSKKIQTLEQLFLDTLKRRLFELCNLNKTKKINQIHEFYAWLIDKNNKEIIINTYNLVKNELNGKEVYGSNTWAIQFYSKISVIRDIEKMNNCFIAEKINN